MLCEVKAMLYFSLLKDKINKITLYKVLNKQKTNFNGLIGSIRNSFIAFSVQNLKICIMSFESFFFLYQSVHNLDPVKCRSRKYIYVQIYIFLLYFIITNLLQKSLPFPPVPSFPVFLALDLVNGYTISFAILKLASFSPLVQHNQRAVQGHRNHHEMPFISQLFSSA